MIPRKIIQNIQHDRLHRIATDVALSNLNGDRHLHASDRKRWYTNNNEFNRTARHLTTHGVDWRVRLLYD